MTTSPCGLAFCSIVFGPLFSKKVWSSAHVLLTGAILTVGPRTISAILRVMGLSQERQFQKFHRVLNRARWSSLAASRRLLFALIDVFVPHGPLIMALDDTIERRRGARIAAKGIYRDPVRSSHSHVVKASGLRWLCLLLIAPIPWAKRCWALPFCTVLAPSQRYYTALGRHPNKLTDRARQLLLMVKRWLPKRSVVVLADSSFAALELLAAGRQHMCMITRLRLDAALYEPAPPRMPGTMGRPRCKGARLPTLQAVLDNSATTWHRITIPNWYSQQERVVDIVSGTAVWYHSGLPAVPVGWVLVRDPQNHFKPQAFLCTDQTISPEQMLAWFVLRWQVEVTFEETRAHLGMQTQRQWSKPAIARTTPIILALYSIVALAAQLLLQQHPMTMRTAAWYDKPCATFSDTIALVRRDLWATATLSMWDNHPDMIKIPRALLHRLTDILCYAG